MDSISQGPSAPEVNDTSTTAQDTELNKAASQPTAGEVEQPQRRQSGVSDVPEAGEATSTRSFSSNFQARGFRSNRSPFSIIKRNNTRDRRKSFENLLDATEEVSDDKPTRLYEAGSKAEAVVNDAEKQSDTMDKLQGLIAANKQRMTLVNVNDQMYQEEKNILRREFEREQVLLQAQRNERKAIDSIRTTMGAQLQHMTTAMVKVKSEMEVLEKKVDETTKLKEDLERDLAESRANERELVINREHSETRLRAVNEELATLAATKFEQEELISKLQKANEAMTADAKETSRRVAQLETDLEAMSASDQRSKDELIKARERHEAAMEDLRVEMQQQSDNRLKDVESELSAYANASQLIGDGVGGDTQKIAVQQKIQEQKLADAIAEIARLTLLVEDNRAKDAAIRESEFKNERLKRDLEDKSNQLERVSELFKQSEARLKRALDGFKKIQDQACVEITVATERVHERVRQSDKKLVPIACTKEMERMTWFSSKSVKQRINGPFSGEEDYKLVHEYPNHPNDWIALAKLMPGRSDFDIKNRWKEMCEDASTHDFRSTTSSFCGGNRPAHLQTKKQEDKKSSPLAKTSTSDKEQHTIIEMPEDTEA